MAGGDEPPTPTLSAPGPSPMYHHPASASRRGGRAGGGHHRPPPPSSRSQEPPSSAAAKAAAAAKALHRKARERAQERREMQMSRGRPPEDEPRGGRPDPRNDVFRKSPPGNANDNRHPSRSEGGSILKRLTAGHHQRSFHLGLPPPDGRRDGDVDRPRERSEDSAAPPKYLHHPAPHGQHPPPYPPPYPPQPYPPPPPGMSESYPPPQHPGPPPTGPYGGHRGGPPKFAGRHPHHYPGPAADERKDGPDGANADGDDGRHAKSMPPRHHSAPHPYYERYADPPPGHKHPPYGPPPPHPPPHSHYPHHYPPPPETWNPAPRDYLREHGEKDRGHYGSAAKEPPAPNEPAYGKPESGAGGPRDADGAHRPTNDIPSRGPTRCIIGTHTPIHVPRAASAPARDEEEEPLPYGDAARGDRGSVFRPSEGGVGDAHRKDGRAGPAQGEDVINESSAHEILLSLSKSFDRGEGRYLPKGGPRGGGTRAREDRPRSPDEPPRIQHWHKQSSDSFEPQPSPLKLSYSKDADGANIGLTSSFTLFSESFGVEMEGLLGPNPSFGLGPMRSLSFGLGLGPAASVDCGDEPGSAAGIQRQDSKVSLKAAGNDGGTDEQEGGMASSPEQKRPRANLQVLRASPSSSFGNIARAGNQGGGGGGGFSHTVGNSSITVLIGGRHVGSPIVEDYGRANVVDEPKSHGCAPKSHGPRSTDSGKGEGEGRGCDAGKGREKHGPPRPHRVDRSLLGAMKRHSPLFNMFSYLLPGAKAELADDTLPSPPRPARRDEELARRRVNAALCAFGGVALPPTDSEVWPELEKWRAAQKCQESVRYYEDENRLSWEIEEDPPIEFPDSDDDTDRAGKAEDGARKRDLDSLPKTSLQRNIGVMVYPAVNAFTATEPGIITPALSDMNNFVDNNALPPEPTPEKAQSKSYNGTNSMPPMVSPDSIRPGSHTPSSSSASTDRKTPQRSVNYAGGAWISNHQSPRKVSPGKKSECPSTTDLLFVDMQELQPEQYRIVALKKRKLSSARYLYPALPLPYGQRKRISNAMFAMSKSIPGLTDECASVLGEARRRDAWDFAVAQLMTQVIVVTHCSVEDSRLDGLSKYLLTLGIAC